MISDYTILGLSQNASISEIKRAYRKKVKELHPDALNSSETIKSHFLFIEVCKAYERLCKTVVHEQAQNVNIQVNNQSDKTIARHKDPAYVYYKKACKYFELVHPSHWNINPTITLNGKTVEDNELQERTLNKVKSLVSLFPKAYYYFSIVVHEYQNSVWAEDSREKMGIIEKRMETYKKILESFITWNESQPLIKHGKDQYTNFYREYLNK